MAKQLSAVMAFEFRWTNSHLKKFRIETRNLLGERLSPDIRWDSKQTMVMLSTIGKSMSKMEETTPPSSQPTMW
jgi:hypothetical protein